MSLRPTLDFLLHDWLGVEALTRRERFAEHSRETFDAVLDTCERIAREKYAPFNRLVDTQEPVFDGEKVILPQATHEAWKAYAASGMLGAAQSYEIGGMQLPYTVEAAANAFFAMASVSIGAGLLTVGNANLLMAHGSEAQRRVRSAVRRPPDVSKPASMRSTPLSRSSTRRSSRPQAAPKSRGTPSTDSFRPNGNGSGTSSA